VQPLRRSWADAAQLAAAGAVGLAAEANLYEWSDAGSWVPDLLTGWTLVVSGLVARGRPGLLLTASGFAWFAGNFEPTALLLHRAPLAQLILSYPRGQAEGRVGRATVTFAYVVCVAGAIWAGDPATFALAVVLLIAASRGYLKAVGLRRRQLSYALRAAGLFAAVLSVSAGANLIWHTASERNVSLHIYQAGLVALAAVLVYGLIRQPWQRAGIIDLVVELGETRTGNVRDSLAQALGDSTLDVAYRVGGVYVDGAGRPVSLQQTRAGRHVTRIERDGAEVAIVLHDAAVLDDPALLEAVGGATRLAATNARLQAEVRTQIAELDASRRRLLEAGDAERRRLERSLHAGALRRLSRLESRLTQARVAAGPATAARIAEAQEQLGKTSSDLRELAAGLHPRDLVEQGLAHAIATLAERSPIPVELKVTAGRLPEDVELTVFFVCSEALANTWKHAKASRVFIQVERGVGTARVEIRDDGVGGADPRSLADRVEGVGGKLEVDSPPGGGTRLRAELPIG
jgi:signal transduction histidine kinase